MSGAITCLHCRAPIEPDRDSPTTVCAYCGYHMRTDDLLQQRGPAPRTPGPAPPVPELQPAHFKSRGPLWIVLAISAVLFTGMMAAITLQERGSSEEEGSAPATETFSFEERHPTPAVDPVRAEEKKISIYVRWLNWYQRSVRRTYYRYTFTYGNKQPSCEDRRAVEIAHLNEFEQRMDEAGERPPEMAELEQVMSSYRTALLRLAELNNEMNTYLSTKQYELDGCNKGEALHPELVEAHAAFKVAQEAARRLLTPKTRGNLTRCKERIVEEYGEGFESKQIVLFRASGDLVARLRRAGQQQDLDVDETNRLLLKFYQTAQKVESLPAARPRWKWATSINDDVTYFLNKVKLFIKHGAGHKLGRSGRRFLRQGYDPAEVDGTLAQTVYWYNQMLQSINNKYDDHCARLIRCQPESCPEPR